LTESPAWALPEEYSILVPGRRTCGDDCLGSIHIYIYPYLYREIDIYFSPVDSPYDGSLLASQGWAVARRHECIVNK
jgi:hypothetical protein